MLLPFTLTAAAIGALLLALGLRGRRTDNHPLCRRCRFDLHGIYPATTTCPECGAAISTPKAIRTGHRRKRRLPLAAGAILLTIAALGSGALAWSRASNFNWNTVKPLWLLDSETHSTNAATAAAAVSELARRIADSKLPPSRATALVERALTLQADPESTWLPEWAALIEAADDSGLLTDEHLARYLTQGIRASYLGRARTRAGDPWPFGLGLTAARIDPAREFWASPVLLDVTVGGRSIPHGWGPGPASYNGISMNSTGSTFGQIALDAEPGVHPVAARWELHLTRDDEDLQDTFTVMEVVLEGEVEVVPPGRPLVRLVKDDDLRDLFQKSARAEQTRTITDGAQTRAAGSITLMNAPTNAAFDIYWRAGDREWKVGAITARAGVSHGMGYWEIIEDFDADTVTIILRASESAAERSLDVEEAWDGQILIPDVPVERTAANPPR